jgi:membrane-associated protein
MSLSFLFNPTHLIETVGLVGIMIVVFAESGLFFGFFLPGDSLLFTAGFLASHGYLNIWLLAIGAFAAAVIGDSVGYAFGLRVGPSLFKKEESFFFKKSYIDRSNIFLDKHGAQAIILARFTPIIRTFAPIVAGMSSMTYSKFLSYNVVGGFLWSVGLCVLGYFLGRSIPNVDRYILPIVVVIIVVSFIPAAYHLLKSKA